MAAFDRLSRTQRSRKVFDTGKLDERARVPPAPSVPSGNIGLKFVDSVIGKQKQNSGLLGNVSIRTGDIIRSDVRQRNRVCTRLSNGGVCERPI